MASIVTGVVGGIVATIVMTAFMLTLGDDSPPPTAAFWAQYVGGGSPDDYMMQGMILHLFYGTVAGAVLAALLVALEGPLPLVESAANLPAAGGLVWRVVYGLVLFAGAAVFWMNIVLDMDPEPRDVGLFVLFHPVYGAVLGGYLVWGVPA